MCAEVLLISGDFNFHLDDPSDNDVKTLSQHETTPVYSSAGDSRKLCSKTSLCNSPQEDSFPPQDDSRELAEDFGKYFCRMIELIKDNIENIVVVPPTAEYRLPDVTGLSEEEVYNIIIKSSNATCSLDPIPTWLLQLCARELTSVIMKMINLSLSEGNVPDSWKVAILTPILKKFGLDLVFENFRPLSNLSFVSTATERLLSTSYLSIVMITPLFLPINRPIANSIPLGLLF